MRTILWQTKSQIVFDSFQKKEISKRANGGNIYDILALFALDTCNDIKVEVDQKSVKKENDNLFKYWLKLRTKRPNQDIFIREPYPIVFSWRKNTNFSIAMIHHIDFDLKRNSIKHKWYFKRLEKLLAKQDLVVTVSKFWKKYLHEIGCKNVKVIYNSFDTREFEISENKTVLFRRKYNLEDSKPLIYIGNSSREKGVYEVYNALKDYEYDLVMTGSTNKAKDLPVRFFNLNREDYLCLLKSCDLVITMSRMLEGWNRIAHEAMLLKKPIIGSGSGGMRELLEGGRQKICTSREELPDLVKHCLKDKEAIGERGYEFACKFNHEYFKNEWINLIEEI